MSASEESSSSFSSGCIIHDHFVHESILAQIISYVPMDDILTCKLVCTAWNDVIKSYNFWNIVHKRSCGVPAIRHFPWYIYYVKFATNFFDTNLVKNDSGQLKLQHWNVREFHPGHFYVENPATAKRKTPFPEISEFDDGRQKTCFATKGGKAAKYQIIGMNKRPVYTHILNMYKPTLVASDWFVQRIHGYCFYELDIRFRLHRKESSDLKMTLDETDIKCYNFYKTDQQWSKKEYRITIYPDNITYITFEHRIYGAIHGNRFALRMAGASLKVLFDTLQDPSWRLTFDRESLNQKIVDMDCPPDSEHRNI